ncbi:MAG: hypothetical protein ACTHU0_13800 [Kofleriaceae bacterium]
MLPILLGLAIAALAVGLSLRGWSFYRLSLEDRVEHPEFRVLRPSGSLGNGYGWIAAMLVVLNLSYLVRRRLGTARLGRMKIWLDVHVATGLTAALLVSFHSAFQLRSPLASLSAASLAIVVATGLIGRYLYALSPSGTRERVRGALDALEAALPGHRDAVADVLAVHPGPIVPANASLLRSLLAVPRWRRAGRARRAAIASVLPPRGTMDPIERAAAREMATAAAAEARASGVAALLRAWRGLHRFFALVMLAAVLLHGGVAWYYGYRWIFA